MNTTNCVNRPQENKAQQRAIFNRFFGKDFPFSHFGGTQWQSPAVNTLRLAHAYRIDIVAPGYQKEDFSIEFDQQVLTIKADKKAEAIDSGEQYIQREFSQSSFKRSFSLPASSAIEQISAKYENGILQITIPDREEEKKTPKVINID